MSVERRLGLTRRQRELLDYIRDYRDQHDISPSYDEMRAALNLRSKNSIFDLVSKLEERGWLVRLHHGQARSLMPVERAPDECAFVVLLDKTDSNTLRSTAALHRITPQHFIVEAVRHMLKISNRAGLHSSQESRATLPDAPRMTASGTSGAAGAGRPHHAPAAPREGLA